jgi:hypothetical protein
LALNSGTAAPSLALKLNPFNPGPRTLPAGGEARLKGKFPFIAKSKGFGDGFHGTGAGAAFKSNVVWVSAEEAGGAGHPSASSLAGSARIETTINASKAPPSALCPFEQVFFIDIGFVLL